MTNHSVAQVPTANASRYLQQLCKHWQHNLEVTFTPEHGTIVFPRDARGADFPGNGLVTFDAKPETLDVRIDATSDAAARGPERRGSPPSGPLRLPRGAAGIRLEVILPSLAGSGYINALRRSITFR